MCDLKRCRALDWNVCDSEYNIPCEVFSPDTFCPKHESERKIAHEQYHYVQRTLLGQSSTSKRRLDEDARIELLERGIYQKRFRFSCDYGHGKWMQHLHDNINSYEFWLKVENEDRLRRLNQIYKEAVCSHELRKCMLHLDSSKKYTFFNECDPVSGDWLTKSEILIIKNRRLNYLDLWTTLRLLPAPTLTIRKHYVYDEW